MKITPPVLLPRDPTVPPAAANVGEGTTRAILGWDFCVPKSGRLTPKDYPGYWTLHMAEMSKKVYEEEMAVRMSVMLGGDLFHMRWFDRGSTQAMGYLHEGHACLVFRGTQQREDWLVDANILMVGSPGRHLGFERAWQLVQPEVMMWLGQVRAALYPLTSIVSTSSAGLPPMVLGGHSLGGALAVLAAYELSPLVTIAGVRTFGAPRVGSPEFAQAYRRRLGTVTEALKHDDDVVPIVPPPLLYQHVVYPRRVVGRQMGMFETPDKVSVAAVIAMGINYSEIPQDKIYKEPVTAMLIAVLFYLAVFTNAISRSIPEVHHAVAWATATRVGYAVLFAFAIGAFQQLTYMIPVRLGAPWRWMAATALALGLAEAHVGLLLVAQCFVWTMVVGIGLLRALMPSATDHFMDKYLAALRRPFYRDAYSSSIDPNAGLYQSLKLDGGSRGQTEANGLGAQVVGAVGPAVVAEAVSAAPPEVD